MMEQKIGQPDDLITRRAAAELAGVDVRTVDRWANEGLITRYKLRGMQWVRFSGAEVARMRAAEIADADLLGPLQASVDRARMRAAGRRDADPLAEGLPMGNVASRAGGYEDDPLAD